MPKVSCLRPGIGLLPAMPKMADHLTGFWLPVADAEIAEHAPAARFVRVVHPERLVEEVGDPPGIADESPESRRGKLSCQYLREESQRLRGHDGIASGTIHTPE